MSPAQATSPPRTQPLTIESVKNKPGYSSCTDLNITCSLDPLIDEMGLSVIRNTDLTRAKQKELRSNILCYPPPPDGRTKVSGDLITFLLKAV